MKIDFGIEPFCDFWTGCVTNSQISILSSKEPSWKYAAYLNDYYYLIEESKTGGIYDTSGTIEKTVFFPVYRFYEEVFPKHINKYFSYETFNFKDDVHGMKKMKELIKQNMLIAVGVDQFYWIPGSVCWNKYHWQHYSLITGYDDEKRIFSVFDVDINKFGCFEVPEERFLQASQSFVRKDDQNTDAYIIKVSEDLKPFKLTLPEVRLYAQKFNQEMENVDAMTLLDLNGVDIQVADLFDLFVKYVHLIINRQIANSLLFKSLLDLNLISDRAVVSGLVRQADNLRKQWRIFEQRMVQNRLAPDLVSKREFCDRYNHLFQQEMKMWNVLLALN